MPYFIKDSSGRFFVGDMLAWSWDIRDAAFYTFPEFAEEELIRTLPKIDKEHYKIYEISYVANHQKGCAHMVFVPWKG